jgi:hypothetical protein
VQTPRPGSESFFELPFQAFSRDVMSGVFRLSLGRDFDPDPRGLELDEVHVV